MIKTGLVSVTFRKFSVNEIVALVSEAGLDGIEWGGDVHVPHGDVKAAENAAKLTAEAGLAVAAYGSYYRIGEEDSPKYSDVLASAVALGTDRIRVWAGRKGSSVATLDDRKRTVDDARQIADLAAEKGITIVTEWHGNTLMDTLDSAKSFHAEVNRENFRTYWQPLVNRPLDVCLKEIDEILPVFSGMHVFSWEGVERQPLAAHASRWEQYFARVAAAGEFYALLEFVKDDSREAFIQDARNLKNLVKPYR